MIYGGFVLEADESEQASKLSYDDMREVGRIRLGSQAKVSHGDDLNDSPFNSNGDIYDGVEIILEKGDYVVVFKGGLRP